MLSKIRRILGLLIFLMISLLFLDFTGVLHAYLGWTAKLQFLPAVLALNLAVVIGLVLLTWVLGRVYCSVICPLGVFQDLISGLRRGKKKARFRYSKGLPWLRYGLLVLFVVALIAGVDAWVGLWDPYSIWGRTVSNLFAPIYQGTNNLLANLAARWDSYAFYSVDVWIRNLPVFIAALAFLVLVVVLAWRGGRDYCNTLCPVGALLGLISSRSLFRFEIDTDKCTHCTLCGKKCKASCIDTAHQHVDHSRCVACFDCLHNCNSGAIRYRFHNPFSCKAKACKPTCTSAEPSANTSAEPSASTSAKNAEGGPTDPARRAMLLVGGTLLGAATLGAQEKKLDGGLAVILDRKTPPRKTPVTPPGSFSAAHFAKHCTGCQLCVSACENQILKPGKSLMHWLQPQMDFSRGFCRPECVSCAEICPTGAIRPITPAEKTGIHIGHAVWIKENCIPVREGDTCGNCARHCPAEAITMVPYGSDRKKGLRIPSIDTAKCLGCGACEYLCPARPLGAIYVEGHEVHHE